MSSETVDRLEARLANIKSRAKEEAGRAIRVAEFVGAVAATSYYRATLAQKGAKMPQVMGFDADNFVGGVLVLAAFFEVLPEAYADHAMAVGAGLMAGGVASVAAGFANPKAAPATKGYMTAGSGADEGAQVIEMIRRARAAALPLSAKTRTARLRRLAAPQVVPAEQAKAFSVARACKGHR